MSEEKPQRYHYRKKRIIIIFALILLFSSTLWCKSKIKIENCFTVSTEETDSINTPEKPDSIIAPNVIKASCFNSLRFNFSKTNYDKMIKFQILEQRGIDNKASVASWSKDRIEIYYTHDRLNRRYDPDWIEYRLYKYSNWDLLHRW